MTVGYNARPDLATMLWGFSIGLGVTLFGLLARIVATFPFAVKSISAPVRALARAHSSRYWPIALGGLFGAIGAWIDKWVVWLSPFGIHDSEQPAARAALRQRDVRVLPGRGSRPTRPSSPISKCNSSAITGCSIPASSSTPRSPRSARMAGDCATRPSHRSPAITVPQLLICALVALSAPVVVDVLDMQYRQVGTLRLGVIGAAFQFLFITCSSLTLYFDRRIVFLLLQTTFIVLNAALTWVAVRSGRPISAWASSRRRRSPP